ncbi:hypothetical protein KIPB_001641, partial [Kipferlia bialata]|eukprot:g1641.t1
MCVTAGADSDMQSIPEGLDQRYIVVHQKMRLAVFIASVQTALDQIRDK